MGNADAHEFGQLGQGQVDGQILIDLFDDPIYARRRKAALAGEGYISLPAEQLYENRCHIALYKKSAERPLALNFCADPASSIHHDRIFAAQIWRQRRLQVRRGATEKICYKRRLDGKRKIRGRGCAAFPSPPVAFSRDKENRSWLAAHKTGRLSIEKVLALLAIALHIEHDKMAAWGDGCLFLVQTGSPNQFSMDAPPGFLIARDCTAIAGLENGIRW
ncbi:MAG: hypothetical protein BGO05_08840 [Rhizobiales bacterium 63-7]|nr:MAG: hypothetical protein BGO05_08840 [Rhizobiales bacterium 63-7]